MSTQFQKSESIINIAKALLTFSVKIGKIKKEANNPFFKSKYAPLPLIQDAIETPLQESGLVLTQLPCGEALVTMLIHAETGEYIMATSEMKPVKNDPQSIGSAITYQRRYSIAALLNLNIDEDDDGNAASQHNTKAPTKPKLEKGTPQFKEAVKYLKNTEGATIQKIEEKYTISPDTKQALIDAASE